MKSREKNLVLRRFQVEEKSRQVGQIETMIEEFERLVKGLDLEIEAEQRRTGISDESHFAYSTFARAAEQRRGNLLTSISDLQVQYEAARIRLAEAEAELAKEEGREERSQPASGQQSRRLASSA